MVRVVFTGSAAEIEETRGGGGGSDTRSQPSSRQLDWCVATGHHAGGQPERGTNGGDR
jgi:hypothetical protein